MQTERQWVLFSTMTFFAGLVVGLSSGILYAPQKGIRTRQKLKNLAEDATEQVEDWAEDTKHTMEGMVTRAKKVVERRVSPS